MKGRRGSARALGLLLGVASMAWGQAGMPSQQPQDRAPYSPLSGRDREHDESSARMQQQQARSRNTDRQKKLVEDTNKLLSLATELKGEVDKTDKNMLSLDVIKKADEIEKLAHNVKERMKS